MRKSLATITVILLSVIAVLVYLLTTETPTNSSPPKPVASPAATVDAGLEAYYVQTLEWSDCSNGFECSVFAAPVDYANPEDGDLSISVIRKVSTGKSLGSLILNPGGPGGSGIEYTTYVEYVVSKTLQENFDIVGFDPRGVGASTPVDCLDDEQTDVYVALDGSPDNQAEIDDAIKMSQDFAQACATKSPDLYKFVDTVSAAKDIDILRALLGDEKLNWLGKSYGTFLGAIYADLFPDKVGRMVLDGAIDPGLTNELLSYGQAMGFELALERFVDDCATRSDCPLDASGAAGISEVNDLLAELDANPIILDDGREFTQAMGTLGVVGSLYDKTYGWPDLRTNLTAAFEGDFTGLATSVDYYTGRNENGTYSDNSNDAIAAINCLDRADRASVEQTIELAKKWKVDAPSFGEYLAWSNVGCSFWKTPATGVAKTISAPGTPTILVVGTVNDPATPYEWSMALADQLSSGVLLTLDGDGHTAYFQGSACIDEVVDDFYLTGKAESEIICSDGP